jgi:hypothetical protein
MTKINIIMQDPTPVSHEIESGQIYQVNEGGCSELVLITDDSDSVVILSNGQLISIDSLDDKLTAINLVQSIEITARLSKP